MAKMTLNQSAMIIDFDAYLDICADEASKLSDEELLNKFSSHDSYEECLEATGISKEEYSYSEYKEVFNQVKPYLDKSLADFREWYSNKENVA